MATQQKKFVVVPTAAATVPDVANQVERLNIRHAHDAAAAAAAAAEAEAADAKQTRQHRFHLLHKYNSSDEEQETCGNSEDEEDHDDQCCPRSPVTFGPSPAVNRSHGLKRLLKNNRAWSRAIRERRPDFFEKGSKGQQPKVFWIGCSDSRVPENELLQLAPGEVFTHRNIANVVVSTDLNCLSVLQYAVDVLKVEHVVVCGHYGCGGVAAALGDQSYGLIDHWLANIKEVKQQHRDNLLAIKDQEERCRALVEINCRNSVLTVAKSPILKAAWARGQTVEVVGMVYDIQTGLLGELGYHVNSLDDLEAHLKIDSNALFAARG